MGKNYDYWLRVVIATIKRRVFSTMVYIPSPNIENCTFYTAVQNISTLLNKGDINISQGRVAKHLRCGGIFNDQFTANLCQSLLVKEC